MQGMLDRDDDLPDCGVLVTRPAPTPPRCSGARRISRAWDTDAVFDLGAWVIALLAESGRKKLTTLVFGAEQERALRSVAKAAIELTAREHPPSGRSQSQHQLTQLGCRGPAAAASGLGPASGHQIPMPAQHRGGSDDSMQSAGLG